MIRYTAYISYLMLGALFMTTKDFSIVELDSFIFTLSSWGAVRRCLTSSSSEVEAIFTLSYGGRLRSPASPWERYDLYQD